MELIEHINLSAAKWLITQSKKSLTYILKRRSTETDTIEVKYNKLTNYLKTAIANNGINQRIYTYSLNCQNNQLGGRLYCPFSCQSIQREFRGVLMKHTTDVDMSNAHPCILRYVCRLHNIPCPQLEYYINHRDEVLASFPDIDKAKTMFLCSINDSKVYRTERSKVYKDFDKEMKIIQRALSIIPEYTAIKNNINSTYNLDGKLMSRILSKYENDILQEAINFISSKDIRISVLMFDGLMINGDYYNDTELLDGLMNHCNSKFDQLDMVWKYKAHSTDLEVPPNIDVAYVEQIKPSAKEVEHAERIALCAKHLDELNMRVADFEKNYCKIINKGMYLHEYQNEDNHKVIQLLTGSQLADSQKHQDIAFNRYHLTNGTGLQPTPFINFWTEANPTIRQYDDVDVYPNKDACPLNIYNLWTPFYGDTLLHNDVIEVNTMYIDFFKNHLKVLSGNDMGVYRYFKKWIAHLFQYPEQKSTCPILISQQGAGKGTLNQVMKLLLGGKKYMETTNPTRDVFGAFNGQMTDSYYVNINEISKKDLTDYMGLLKGLITDNALTINQKGIAQYNIKSFHRFIMTTNNTDPIVLSSDDRRFWVVRSSDEFIGNKEYFDTFNEYMKDPSFIKSIYHYFMSMDGIDQFIKLPLPVTEFHRNIQESNISDVDRWLKSYVLMNHSATEMNVLIKDLYTNFCTWSEGDGGKYKITNKKFSLELSNTNVKGIHKGVHTKYGDTKILNITELKKYFGIGYLVNIGTNALDEDIDPSRGL